MTQNTENSMKTIKVILSFGSIYSVLSPNV